MNKNCPKCNGKGYFEVLNHLTNNIIKIPCLCIPEGMEKHPIVQEEILKNTFLKEMGYYV